VAVLEDQSPDPLDPGEALICTIGLTRILQNDMPKVGVMLQREALDLPRRLAVLARQMVNDELPRALKMPRPFSYDKLLELTSNPLPEHDIEATMAKFPASQSDVAASFIAKLASVHKQLSDIVPVMQYQTCLGPQNIQPTGDKLFKFWNQYWVLDDPTIVFTLAQSGALLPDQVTALVSFYPSLYEQFKTATLNALVKKRLDNASFINLPPRTDRGVTTLLQNKMVPFGSNQRLTQDDRSLGQGQDGPGPVAQSVTPRRFQSQAEKASDLT
jgi:hypothetical protein